MNLLKDLLASVDESDLKYPEAKILSGEKQVGLMNLDEVKLWTLLDRVERKKRMLILRFVQLTSSLQAAVLQNERKPLQDDIADVRKELDPLLHQSVHLQSLLAASLYFRFSEQFPIDLRCDGVVVSTQNGTFRNPEIEIVISCLKKD